MSESDHWKQPELHEEQIAHNRLRKIANAATNNPYEKSSTFAQMREKILNSIKWRLEYKFSAVKPHENWYLAASLWPLLIDSENELLQTEILKCAIDKQLDSSGNWRYALDTAYKFLMCIHVVRLWELTGDKRYLNAANNALNQLTKLKKASNGAFLYLPTRDEILVDTLGMIGPFLGACAKTLGSKEASHILKEQLQLYWHNNMDTETGLPYHGYYAGGPNKLGNLGWGRGVGWYMLALSAVQNCNDNCKNFSDNEYNWKLKILQTLLKHQRDDGHWSENILINSKADASATGMIMLALTSKPEDSAKKSIIDDRLLRTAIQHGRQAIVKSTGKHGLILNSTGEAPALGSYSHAYGNYPWTQGFCIAALIQSNRWIENNQCSPAEKPTLNQSHGE